MKKRKMRTYYLFCSMDGDVIDYEATIRSFDRPDSDYCRSIAEAHGCILFYLREI